MSNSEKQEAEIIDLPENKRKIGGWLMFFCLVLILISPVSAVLVYHSTYQEVSPHWHEFSSLKAYFYTDLCLGLPVLIFSIKAGISLLTLKKNAVTTAKIVSCL